MLQTLLNVTLDFFAIVTTAEKYLLKLQDDVKFL